jgi:hypothetical protein
MHMPEGRATELCLFFDKYDVGFEGGVNSGFRNWHPIPSVANLTSMVFVHQIVTGQQQGLRNMEGRGSNYLFLTFHSRFQV